MMQNLDRIETEPIQYSDIAKHLGISIQELNELGRLARQKEKAKNSQPSELFCHGCWFCPPVGYETTLLHKHHIVPRANGGQDEKSNLIHLCPNCHALAHILIREERLFGVPTREELGDAIRSMYNTCKRRKFGRKRLVGF